MGNEEKKEKSVFETLNDINVNDHVEKRNGLKYLSWAWAWSIAKKYYPNSKYVIYERDTQFGRVPYFTDGKTCWVKTGVIIEGLEYIEQLPVMDFRNKSIAYDNITSFDVNKAIQRSLTKALARHGLGLYIYAGEDLPSEEKEEKETIVKEKEEKENKKVNDLMQKVQNLKTKLSSIGVDIRGKVETEYILAMMKNKTGIAYENLDLIEDLKKLQAMEEVLEGVYENKTRNKVNEK